MAHLKEKKLQFYSLQLEASLKSDDAGRVHAHLYVHTNGLKFSCDAELWTVAGSRPHVSKNSAKGRGFVGARNRGHYYAQVPKRGWLFKASTFPMHQDFAVEPRWAQVLYQERKLTKEVFLSEVLQSRARIKGVYLDATWAIAKEAELAEAELIEETSRDMDMFLRPFKKLAAVEEWKLQYLDSVDGGPVFPLRRFRFLVLTGPSMFGKTSFASCLYKRTLILQCQGVAQPNLLAYDKSKFDCIVMDEASWDKCVIKNKQLFQAFIHPVLLGQSPCQYSTYQRWLFRTPIVVCCNDWMFGADPITQQPDIDWLNVNSVVVHVTDFLYG